MNATNTPIMFHDFHDNNSKPNTQGSVNQDYIYKLIKYIGIKNILSPEDYILKYNNNKLNKNHLCLTFDDGLKSQLKIAYPILNEFKIRSFFFIPSTYILNKDKVLESYKHFYMNYYSNVNFYYEDFFNELYRYFDKKKLNILLKNYHYKIIKIMKLKSFYSYQDIQFRLIRNSIISNVLFSKVNKILFKNKKFDYQKINKNKYLNENDLILIAKENKIGLHSQNHFFNIRKFSYFSQYNEYKNNKKHLSSIINNQIINSLSYPSGVYNHQSVKILKKLKINFAFRNVNKKYHFNYEKQNKNLFVNRNNHIEYNKYL